MGKHLSESLIPGIADGYLTWEGKPYAASGMLEGLSLEIPGDNERSYTVYCCFCKKVVATLTDPLCFFHNLETFLPHTPVQALRINEYTCLTVVWVTCPTLEKHPQLQQARNILDSIIRDIYIKK